MRAGCWAILVFSLAGNALLVASLLRSPALPAPLPVLPAKSSVPQSPASAPIEEAPLKESPVAEPARFTWAQLESTDYPEYIARLRAFGVPERVVRDIIIADVAKLYRPRLAALRPPKSPPNPNFWETRGGIGPSPHQLMTFAQREEQRLLQKEQTDLIKALLGHNVYREMTRDSGNPDWLEVSMDYLPPDVRDKVAELNEKYQNMRSEIYSKGSVDANVRSDVKALQKKMREDMAQFMTPEQLREYDLRSSDLSMSLRYELASFKPTEAEFRFLFEARQDAEELRESREPGARPTAEELKARAAREEAWKLRAEKEIGPERLKELEILNHYTFQRLDDLGFPKETIFKVSDMHDQTSEAVSRILADLSIPPEKRLAAVHAIQRETESTLLTLLGERKGKAYLNSGGTWVRRLSSRIPAVKDGQ